MPQGAPEAQTKVEMIKEGNEEVILSQGIETDHNTLGAIAFVDGALIHAKHSVAIDTVKDKSHFKQKE